MKSINFPKEVPISGRVKVCLDLIKNYDLRNKVIVDVGSSFGWLEKEMIKLGPKKIIGVEIDDDAVAFAKGYVRGAEFLVGNALNLPVEDNCADIIILFDLIEHVPKGTEQSVLEEVGRVLKNGGLLFLSTPNSNIFSNIFDIAWYFGHRHYTKKSILKLLKPRGFRILSIVSRGSILSSLFLTWFYIAKRVQKTPQPRNLFFEWLDNIGYKDKGITDIFLVAKKYPKH